MGPHIIILAGPNGAGKTTAAPLLLKDTYLVDEFVNADTIAKGLSAFEPEKAAIEAGRIMLRRLDQLAAERVSFAFETTLASRTFVPWLKRHIASGYRFHLFYLWVPVPEFSIARVADRVRKGGHFVPEETIRRRYEGGLRNFFELYSTIANSWSFFDNAGPTAPRLIATQSGGAEPRILDVELWATIKGKYSYGATEAYPG